MFFAYSCCTLGTKRKGMEAAIISELAEEGWRWIQRLQKKQGILCILFPRWPPKEREWRQQLSLSQLKRVGSGSNDSRKSKIPLLILVLVATLGRPEIQEPHGIDFRFCCISLRLQKNLISIAQSFFADNESGQWGGGEFLSSPPSPPIAGEPTAGGGGGGEYCKGLTAGQMNHSRDVPCVKVIHDQKKVKNKQICRLTACMYQICFWI